MPWHWIYHLLHSSLTATEFSLSLSLSQKNFGGVAIIFGILYFSAVSILWITLQKLSFSCSCPHLCPHPIQSVARVVWGGLFNGMFMFVHYSVCSFIIVTCSPF